MVANEPLVSIVMTAYNEAKFISEAIESILNQTYNNFEFIIINDGSTDNTEEIIFSYADKRIRYIKNEVNLKLIASLNMGLALATGKYIARMDSDDISMPERLAIQVNYMEQNPEIGISGAQLIIFGSQDSTMNYPVLHEDLLLRLLITSCFPNNLVIFRKEIVDNYNLQYPEGYLHAEDFKFWTEWVFITKCHNLEDYLAKYRFHAASVSHQYRHIQRATRNRVRIEYLTRLFSLSAQEQYIAHDFYGFDYNKRVKAIRSILKINNAKKVLNPNKLLETIFYQYYLDGLENAETDKFMFLKYLNIFSLSITKNYKFWTYIVKQTIKSHIGFFNNK